MRGCSAPSHAVASRLSWGPVPRCRTGAVPAEGGVASKHLIATLSGQNDLDSRLVHGPAQEKLGRAVRIDRVGFRVFDGCRKAVRKVILANRDGSELRVCMLRHFLCLGCLVVFGLIETQREGPNRSGDESGRHAQH